MFRTRYAKATKVAALASAVAIVMVSLIPMVVPTQRAFAASWIVQGYYNGYSWGVYDVRHGFARGAHFPYGSDPHGCFAVGWGGSNSAECQYEYGFALGYVRGYAGIPFNGR